MTQVHAEQEDGARGEGPRHEARPAPRADRRRPRSVAVLAGLAVLILGAGVAVLAGARSDDAPGPPVPATSPPRPQATEPRRPVPPGPSPLLAGLVDAQFDARAGDFRRKFDNSGNDGLVERGGLPRIVANPDDPGRSAWRFSLGPGGKRSEVLPEGRGTKPSDGDVQWVRYTAILDRAFPTRTDGWQLILQWHHDAPTGSPPLALQVTRGQLMMVSEGTDMQAVGPVAPGQRLDLVMRVVFAQDPGRGAVTVWRDGRPTGVTDWRPPEGTMSTRSAYLKMGLYRSTAIRQPGSVTVTDLKIGPTARSVGGTGALPR